MLDFIINPFAGGKNGKKMKKVIDLLKARLLERNQEGVFHYTERPHHATELTKSLIEGGATTIVVVGGDGSLHEVINGFSNFDKTAMGIIPCGTGNDFASALNLPFDPVKALDLILDGDAKYTDFMQMPTVRGLNIIGMGMDVEVLRRYESLKRKTKFGYTKCLIDTLFKFKCINFDADLDDDKQNYDSFIACIANGHRYGGGLRICPVADPTDKSLDMVAVGNMGKLALIGAFMNLKSGKILKHKKVVHKTCKRIKIDVPTPYTVNVDGELYDDIPFEIKIVSDKLRIYRP